MNNKFQKFNMAAGNILVIILFTIFAIFSKGFLRFIAIDVAVLALFYLIYEICRHSLIKYTTYLLFSISISGGGVLLYQRYWNPNAWLIAKIGFLAFVGFFFLASIVGVLISLYLIFNYFKTKKNTK